MMKDIASIQKEIVDNFKLFEEWNDKYEYLMEFSHKTAPVKEAEKTEKNLVRGCQSKVWVVCEMKEKKVWYRSDGDAFIPKGIAATISSILSGHKAEEVLKAEINFHKETDLVLYLSPARVRGLESMIVTFKSLAAQYLMQN